MKALDPSYLRFIYDEIKLARIDTQNAASLPIGLSGFYEKELSKNVSYITREKTIEILAVFAIAQDAVSFEFISSVLCTEKTTQKDVELPIQKTIKQYSKWFNANEQGRLLLYHDRLRVFLLQKVSDQKLRELNDKFIQFIEDKWQTGNLVLTPE